MTLGQSLISMALGEHSMGSSIQASHFLTCSYTNKKIPPLRNSSDTLWPSAPVSENTSRECRGRKGGFAALGTPQAESAAASPASGRAEQQRQPHKQWEPGGPRLTPGCPRGARGGGVWCRDPPTVRPFPHSTQAAASAGEFLLQQWGQGVKGAGCFCKHG